MAVYSPHRQPFSTGGAVAAGKSDLNVVIARPATPTTRPPVLLIHGLCAGAWMWQNYQTRLAAAGYESHALNLRGHHGGRPVRDIGKVAMSDYVDDALEVARSLNNPIVIGHSMGGLIAQKVAEAGVGRALVLIASAPPRWIPIASAKLVMRQLKFMPQLFLFRPILPDRSDADVLMFNRTPLADRDAQYPLLVPDSGRAGFEMSFGVVAVNAQRVTAPTLVVTGLDDQFIVPRIARAEARKYRATLKEFPTHAHHIITEPGWEKPCDEIILWLNERR
jgi:pimeloyl-ACP methyl ester carboxylesterase